MEVFIYGIAPYFSIRFPIEKILIRSSCRYVRCLGAYYLRLTGTALDCYNYLEPLYNDYRKVTIQNCEVIASNLSNLALKSGTFNCTVL